LVIEKEAECKILIEYLLYELNSANGLRDTGLPIYQGIYKEIAKAESGNRKKLLSLNKVEDLMLRRYIKHTYIENLKKKYNLMRIRMKISFMAFEQFYTI